MNSVFLFNSVGSALMETFSEKHDCSILNPICMVRHFCGFFLIDYQYQNHCFLSSPGEDTGPFSDQ